MPVAHLLGLDGMRELNNHEWLKEFISPSNIVYLGVRDIDEDEKIAIKKLGIKYFTPCMIDEEGGI